MLAEIQIEVKVKAKASIELKSLFQKRLTNEKTQKKNQSGLKNITKKRLLQRKLIYVDHQVQSFLFQRNVQSAQSAQSPQCGLKNIINNKKNKKIIRIIL